MIIPSNMVQDRYWGSLLFLFSNNSKLKSYFTTEFIDIKDRRVMAPVLKRIARPWSHSEKFMLNLALHLFNERNKVNLSDMDYLDYENKKLAIDAIKIRYQI